VKTEGFLFPSRLFGHCSKSPFHKVSFFLCQMGIFIFLFSKKEKQDAHHTLLSF